MATHDLWWAWTLFGVFVLAMLALDLGVFHRRSHAVTIRESLVWTGVWIGLALLFNVLVWVWRGQELALQFLASYVLEKSLSVDNIFVFILIFRSFQVAPVYQHKVLFWGILGALVMRAVFIALGIAALEAFHWMIYVFGGILILTGIKMARHKEEATDPGRNPVLRLLRRFVPIADDAPDGRFFARRAGRWMATPLFAVLVVVETTDVVFAIDSIPAVLAISTDPFIVYTSNVFAILGLRALYFAVAGMLQMFHHLHHGLSVILVFVGSKMALSDVLHVPVLISVGVILLVLAAAVVSSLLWPKPLPEAPPASEPLFEAR